jgi:hypothetical protein
MGEARRRKEQTQKPRLKHAPGDALSVIQAANAFREYSRPFCDKVRGFPPQQVKQVQDNDFGDLIASATNLAFAIELYIKAVRILHGLGPMRTHDLAALYASLPKTSRRRIQATYAATIQTLDPSPSPLVVVRIAHRDAPQDEARRTDKLPDNVSDVSFERVLERSRDLFERWRYLYDQGKHGTVVWLYYEYRWLEVAADALRNHATYSLGAAP